MRRRSRECALQILYQLDLNAQTKDDTAAIDVALSQYWRSFDDPRPVDRELTERLVRGVLADLAAVDESIAAASARWRVDRMPAVDRNLIRVAAYEILRCPDIPVGVSINEALEIAKRFSGGDSVPFINGVLDHIARGAGEEREP